MVRSRSTLVIGYLALIMLTGAGSSTNAAQNPCSSLQAEAAQAAVEAAKTWPQLALAQQRFPHCDAGYVAEANSEAVARLLVDHWDTVSQLDSLAAAQPWFLQFVLLHLDTTLDAADLEHVLQLANTQCRRTSRRLCARLASAARRAIADSRK